MWLLCAPCSGKERIKVRVQDDVLIVEAERKQEREEEPEKGVKLRERTFGKFLRTFKLPDNAKPDQITAQVKDGTLEIKIPKTEARKPETKEIPVSGEESTGTRGARSAVGTAT